VLLELNQRAEKIAGMDERDALAGDVVLRLAAAQHAHAILRQAAYGILDVIDAERGLLQPLVVRPLGRTHYLLGRFLAAAAVSAAYVLVVYFGAMLVTGWMGDWWPAHPLGAALRLASLVRRQPSETLSARRSNRRGRCPKAGSANGSSPAS